MTIEDKNKQAKVNVDLDITSSWLLSPYRQWYYRGERGKPPMSLAITVTGLDAIVLASDSKETEGTRAFQRSGVQKIKRLTDSVWMTCFSNYAEFTSRITDDFCNDVIGKLTPEEQRQWDIREVGKQFESYANTEYMKLQQDQQKTTLSESQPLENQIEFILAGYTIDTVPEPKIRRMRVRQEIHLPPFILEQAGGFSFAGISQVALYWLYKINRIAPLHDIDSNTLKILIILIFAETIKLTPFVGAPLDIVIIRPKGVADRITISETRLEKIQNELGSVINDQMILDKLVKLGGNQDLLTGQE